MAEKGDTVSVVCDTTKAIRPQGMIIFCANLTDDHEDEGMRSSKFFGKLKCTLLNETQLSEMLIL